MGAVSGSAAAEYLNFIGLGVSGIRGVVGEFLTPALACQFAEAFGTYVGAGRVVVGRDTRSSGPMLEHAVICGLLAAGCEVVELGILPTPTIQMYVAATRARGGAGGDGLPQSAGVQRAQAVQQRRPVLQQLRTRRTARPLSSERIPPRHQRRDARRSGGSRAGAEAAHRARAATCGCRAHPRAQVPRGAGCGERRGLADDVGIPDGHAGVRSARDLGRSRRSRSRESPSPGPTP